MVVDDDDIGTERSGRRQRLDAGGAAIDRDDQPGALFHQRLDGLPVGAVALGHAIGDVDARIAPVRRQEALEQCR